MQYFQPPQLVIVDRESGIVIHADSALAQLLGYNREDIEHSTWRSAVELLDGGVVNNRVNGIRCIVDYTVDERTAHLIYRVRGCKRIEEHRNPFYSLYASHWGTV